MKNSKIKVDRFIYNELKRITKLKPENAYNHVVELLRGLSPISQRTNPQNRALHMFFNWLAESLNEAGIEMKVVLKGETKIWWTPDSVKEYLWRPVQKAMYGTESTTELEKHVEIENIHESLMRILMERHGIENIPFPHDPNKKADIEGAMDTQVEYPDENLTPTF